MRKVKDAKDLSSNELIYFKGHAKATYMSDGTTVEDAILSNQGGAIPDLSDYATKIELNSKVDKVDGKQLSTEDFTTLLKLKLEELSNYDDTTINSAVSNLQSLINTLISGNVSSAINSFNEIIAFLNGITDNQSLDSIIASIEQLIAGKMDKVTLAAVATSGNYNDLSNKPTIPTAITESTVSGWGFTKNTGTYSKPSGGIPKTDLASAVQTSLGKADTALQSYTEQYKGTVTGVKINGTTKNPSNGVVDLGTVITSHQDISGKLDKLVSGTNIKTINGLSLLGSGDITISGGSGSGSNAYSLVNHGTSDTTFTLTPNTFHVWDEVGSLTLTLGSELSGIANEYLFLFTSGSIATTLSLPANIIFSGDDVLSLEPNKVYQISILNGMATIMDFLKLCVAHFSIGSDASSYPQSMTFYFKSGMTWLDFINSKYNIPKENDDGTINTFYTDIDNTIVFGNLDSAPYYVGYQNEYIMSNMPLLDNVTYYAISPFD